MLHEANFLECVKSRKRPSADVEIGRLSTTLCHLGKYLSSPRPRRAFRPSKRNIRR